MSKEPDIWVSNGTCYIGARLIGIEVMLPCGNDYFGHIACCQAGDYCLESSTCYNGDYRVTYIAGCTDPEYQHQSCPPKFTGDNQLVPWMGLSYCNGTSDEWLICDQKRLPATITSPDPCYCPTATAERSKTIKQSSRIPAVAMLPTASGGSIEFFVGHYPTATKSATAAAITTITLTSTSTTALSRTAVTALTATSQPVHTADNTSTHSTTGFNTAAKIGTAVGVTVFGLLVLAALGYFLLRRRSQKREKQQQQEDNDFVAGGGNDNKPPSDDTIDDPYTHNIGLAFGDPNEASPVFDPHFHAAFELHSDPMRCWPSHASEAELYNLASPSTLSSMRMSGGHGSQGHGDGYGDGKAGPSKSTEQPLAELPG